VGDKLMLARAKLAEGAPDSVKGWQAIASICREPRCAGLRADAREASARLWLAAGNPDKALRDALEAAQLRRIVARAEDRLYVRSAVLDEACAAREAAAGPGMCRKQEQRAGLVFHDFSKQTEAGEGLSAETLKKVSNHFTVLLQPCLDEEARRSEDARRLRVEWTILNHGRVAKVKVPGREANHPLVTCLTPKFARWRYPKFRGELQHAEQEFLVWRK
jgi:hypothetical protein